MNVPEGIERVPPSAAHVGIEQGRQVVRAYLLPSFGVGAVEFFDIHGDPFAVSFYDRLYDFI